MRGLRRLIVVGLMATATCVYAGNGDLIVDGKLGVGTVSPGAKLDIQGGSIAVRDNPSYAPAFMEGASGVAYFGAVGNSRIAIGNQTNWERLSILDNGNVGIGTTNPTNILTVTGTRDGGTSNITGIGFTPTLFTSNVNGLNQTGVSINPTFNKNNSNVANGKSLYVTGVASGIYNVANAYSLYVDAPTGATNNYAAVFQGGNVGIGTTSPSYTLHVNGSFGATSKSFDIPDPRYNDEKRRLVHASIEGPEVGVYYRGEVKLESGRAVVKLPDYFEALTRKENRTVLLTPKFENDSELLCNVAASGVKDSAFTIRSFGAPDLSACNHKVYWEVKAERSDIERLKVEQIREGEAGKSN